MTLTEMGREAMEKALGIAPYVEVQATKLVKVEKVEVVDLVTGKAKPVLLGSPPTLVAGDVLRISLDGSRVRFPGAEDALVPYVHPTPPKPHRWTRWQHIKAAFTKWTPPDNEEWL